MDEWDIYQTEEVAAWEAARNKHHAKADWQFTTDDARTKLRHLYPTLRQE